MQEREDSVLAKTGVQGAKQEREDSVLAKEQECEDSVLTTKKGRIFHGETLGRTLHAVHR